jgi:hypothetical protein
LSSELVEVKHYAIMSRDPREFGEILAANAGARGVYDTDFERIRVPSGKAQFFELQTLEGPQSVPHIDCVIVDFKEPRLLYGKSFDESDGAPPVCKSDDGLTGVGNPGGDCVCCPEAAYGGRCGDYRYLAVIMAASVFPSLVVLPRMSMKPCRAYFHALSGRGHRFNGVVTRVGLAPTTRKGMKGGDGKVEGAGTPYTVATFKFLCAVPAEERVKIAAIATAFAPIFHAMKVIEGDRKVERENGDAN